MPLAIDELVKKALDTANLSVTIPQVWRRQLEPLLRKRAQYQPSLTVFNELLGQPGDRIHIPTLPELGSGVAALTESTDMTPIQLAAATEVVLQPTEYGLSVEISRKSLDRINFDGMAEIMDRLAYQMTLKLENDIGALWNKAVPGTATKMAVQYPNGHTSATIVAGDTISDAVLLNALTTLQAANVPTWDDGHYILYVSPKQFNDMLKDTDIRADLRFAQPGASLINGELAVYHNIRIVVTNFTPTATENTITAYKALLVAPRWAAVAWKRQPELVVDPTVYDLGRRRRFGITADYDIELIHADRGLVITTA